MFIVPTTMEPLQPGTSDQRKQQPSFNTWATNVKLTWDVPRGTRTYLLQQVLAPGLTLAKTEVLARFVSLFWALRFAPSHEIRTITFLVSRNLRTVIGQNLALVGELSGEDPWSVSTHLVRESLK